MKRLDKRYHLSEISDTITTDFNQMTTEVKRATDDIWRGANAPVEFLSGPDRGFTSSATRPAQDYRTPTIERK
jgi:hypothetical protein